MTSLMTSPKGSRTSDTPLALSSATRAASSPRVLSVFADCSPKTDETTTLKTLASKEWAPARMRMAFSRS